MKKKDLQAARNKKMSELKKLVSKKKQEVEVLQAKVKAGQEKNLKKAKNIRIEIAQLLTLIREKEIIKKEEKKDK
ncbi:MAG: 50S ribosomal protein L29 [Patescibacteria group bacterium]